MSGDLVTGELVIGALIGAAAVGGAALALVGLGARRRAELGSAFEAIAEAVMVVAPDGTVLHANAAASRLLADGALRGRALLGISPQLEVARRAARTGSRRLPLEGDLAGFEVSVSQLPGSGRLARAAVLVVHDQRRDREAAQRLQADAFRDALTGVANRRGFEVQVTRALSNRGEGAVGLVYVDLDGFKSINDTLGHAAGDTVLVTVARRLEGMLRDGDSVARIGGDEFAILLPNITPSGLASIPARVAAALARPIRTEGTQVALGASVGLASAPRDGRRADALLEAADGRMYRHKQGKDERDPRLTSESLIGDVSPV